MTIMDVYLNNNVDAVAITVSGIVAIPTAIIIIISVGRSDHTGRLYKLISKYNNYNDQCVLKNIGKIIIIFDRRELERKIIKL